MIDPERPLKCFAHGWPAVVRDIGNGLLQDYAPECPLCDGKPCSIPYRLPQEITVDTTLETLFRPQPDDPPGLELTLEREPDTGRLFLTGPSDGFRPLEVLLTGKVAEIAVSAWPRSRSLTASVACAQLRAYADDPRQYARGQVRISHALALYLVHKLGFTVAVDQELAALTLLLQVVDARLAFGAGGTFTAHVATTTVI